MEYHAALGFGASALAVGAVALAATAGAAPTGPSRVDETVRTLQASGYHVILDRTGAASLSECTITGVRSGVSKGSDTVYVDVAC